MSNPSHILYPFLNLVYGASIGTATALCAHQNDAWTGRPSTALLLVGAAVIFGTAYVVTVTVRGRRPTLQGAGEAAASAATVFGLSTLAVTAPAWVLVWAAAALIGLGVGLLRPLPSRRRRAPESQPLPSRRRTAAEVRQPAS